MARFEDVKSIINTYIKPNGKEEITGEVLQNVLRAMMEAVDIVVDEVVAAFPQISGSEFVDVLENKVSLLLDPQGHLGNTGRGLGVVMDKVMSDDSLNPVSNKVVKAYIDKIRSDLNVLVSGDLSSAIDNFNEIIEFLSSIEDSETLSGIIAGLETALKKYADGVAQAAYEQSYSDSVGASSAYTDGKIAALAAVARTGSYNDLKDKPTIPTGGGGATPRVEMTASSAAIEPNKFYVWPMMDSLDLTLGAEQSGVMNRYLFQFRCPKEKLTILSLPAEVMWSEDVELDDNGLPVMDATAYYRVEIVENLATLKKWKLAYMQFADAEVEKALSEAIGDELGVPVNVAKNLKSFGAWLRGNTAAMTFHEFEQFKKVETIEQNAFNGCTNLALTFPPNVKVIGTAAFSDADAFAETLELPALEELGDYVFRLTNLKKVENLGNIEVLPANNSSTTSSTFGGCTSLTFVRMPSSLKQLGSSVNPASPFRGCSALVNVISEAVTPPSMLVLAFEDCPSTLAIYVPDESVEAYKGAMNWSHYMSRIRPISDYGLAAVVFTFKDAAVQAVIVANWDSNGDGQLSKAEVQSITTLNRKFKGNATIVDCSDFDALTGLTSLLGGYNNGEFYNCTSLKYFAIPPNCKELQYYAFQKCTALESVTGLEYVETMGLAVFDSCTSLVINELRMPNLKGTLRANVFTATTMTRVEDLGAITHIAETGYNKGIFPKTLQFLRLPSTLTDITNYAFQINTNLQTVICEAVVPPTAAQGIFNGSNCPIYVPDESVEAYKAATTWSGYATRIKGMSEYTG